jgi:DNA repair protein RadD
VLETNWPAAEPPASRPVLNAAASAFNTATVAPQQQLRPYQHKVIDDFYTAIRAGKRRPLVCMPTGSGKTVLFAEIIRRQVANGFKVIVLAHRRELIGQASAKLHAAGVDHGIVLAGHPTRPSEPVQVVSIATLVARAIRGSAMSLPPADMIVIDECHHARARTYRKVVDRYGPETIVVGVTATPARGDGRGLGVIFDELILGPSVADLTADGYLVPPRIYAPYQPDMTGVRIERTGDYNEAQVAERMDRPALIGDVLTHYLKHAQGRRAVVFASGVQHSVHLRDRFRISGIMAEHLDGSTPTDERDAILRRLKEGKVEVVTNAQVLVEGWDAPEVECLILARPTNSFPLYLQMAGRVLRPAPGKTDCIILDHSGAVFRHGFPDDPIAWTLAEDRRAENKAQTARADGRAPSLVACPECKAVRFQGQPCGVCGWKPTTRGAAVEVEDGELGLVGRNRRVAKNNYTAADMHNWHAQLAWIARERGFRDGWIYHKYVERFSAKPRSRYVAPQVPTDEVRAWVKSRAIAWAKAQEKRRGAA